MAYVGNPIDTQNTFQSLQGKRFSGDGSTTAFTLDVAPSSTLDIEVFVGNVRQDPNSAYTLSGTTLTFTGAPPSGTNNIYVVHQAKSVGTIDVPAGGVQAGSLASSVLTGQTDIGAAIADADLFLVDDGAGGTLRKVAASRIKTYAATTSATDSFSITGSTPTLTIGDAGAEDTKIVFDGNAQDYHIGLDDSADSLVIGKGSALGTTSHIVTDENGHVTKPLQSAFLFQCSTQSNATGGGQNHTIPATNERFDTNADLASDGTFTAPVTGKYLFCGNYAYENPTSSHDRSMSRIITSNRTYTFAVDPHSSVDSNNTRHVMHVVIADMDANDTMTFNGHVSGSGQTVEIKDEGHFSGMLIG